MRRIPITKDRQGTSTTCHDGVDVRQQQPRSGAIVKVLNQPSVKAHFAEADKEQVGSSPAEFKRFIATEVERLRMQVRISGAKVD